MLKIPFLEKKVFSQKKYFGLFLKEQEGIAMILTKKDGKVFLEKKERFLYSNGWENLIEDVDDVLLRLEGSSDFLTEEMIIFVYSHLVDEKTHEIKKPYLKKIKELVKNLEFKPLGYIECYEAVAEYLHKKEETPTTAILVELDKTNLSIFIYKGGRQVFVKILSRTDNLIDDLIVGFEELKGKFLLPSRIILYNSKDLNQEGERIISYRWGEEYFVQIPRVEILTESEVINAVISVFEKQITVGEEVNQTEKEFSTDKREVLGFVIGEDIAEIKPEEEIKEKKAPIKTFSLAERLKLFFLPKLKLPRFNWSLPKNSLFFIGILLIMLAIFINEYFFHTAKLTIIVPSQTIDKKFIIEDLKINLATVSAEFSDTIKTTGKKEIGDKAYGEVTVYNSNLSSGENLTKGSLIIAPNNLKFVLDSDVKVASATGDAISPQPATAVVKVTAENIGEEYNLPANTKFRIEGKSANIIAKNELPFTGGSKKQIKTVAKKDLESLEINLINKAKSQNKLPDLNQKQKPIESLTSIKLTDLRFSKEVGEEVEEVSLKAKVNRIFYLYDEEQLKNRLITNLQKEVSPGFKLDRNKLDYTIDKAENKKDRFQLTIHVSARMIKDISPSHLQEKLVGVSKDKLDILLKTDYEIRGYELKIRQFLPLLSNFMPFFKKNLEIIIK